MEKDENIFRTLLKNEVTWVISVIIAVWTFVSMIILPINTIQSQLAQIQTQLVAFQNVQSDVNILKQQQAVMSTQILSIMRKLNF